MASRPAPLGGGCAGRGVRGGGGGGAVPRAVRGAGSGLCDVGRQRHCGPGPSPTSVSAAPSDPGDPEPGTGSGPREAFAASAWPRSPQAGSHRLPPFLCLLQPQGRLPGRPPPTGRPQGPASPPPLAGPGQKMVQKKTAELQGFHRSFKVRAGSVWGRCRLDHRSDRWEDWARPGDSCGGPCLSPGVPQPGVRWRERSTGLSPVPSSYLWGLSQEPQAGLCVPCKPPPSVCWGRGRGSTGCSSVPSAACGLSSRNPRREW